MKRTKQQIIFSEASASLCLRIIAPAVASLALSCNSYSPPTEQTSPSEQTPPSVASFVRVRLPEGVNRADLKSPSAVVRKKLDAALAEQLSSAPVQATTDVVVYADAQGLVLPDAEIAAALGTAGDQSNDITFTYDSPDYPWSADQLSAVQGWLNTCYPIIKVLYGPPAFAQTVNVRNNPNLTLDGTPSGSPVDGQYNPTLNEFQIRNVRGDVLCHELIHAFRDDYGIGLSSWEEGMTRAVEIEVMKRAGIRNEQDSSYSNNVFHDELNQPCVGVLGSSLASAGWGQGPLRYNLASYAWAKPMLEDFSFYPRFNASYYAQRANNWSVAYDEAALLAIAAETKPLVEDQPFANWIAGQYVLDSSPPVGDFAYIKSMGADHNYVSLFRRSVTGIESVFGNTNVTWTITDSNGTIIGSGSGVTYSNGGLWLDGVAGYAGAAKITVTATPDSTPITSSIYTSFGPQEGIFGVVPGHLTGSVTLTAVDQGAPQVTVPVVNGVFSSPTLTSVSGRIRYFYTDEHGVVTPTATRTKDISPYFVQIDAPVVAVPATPANVTATAGSGQVQLTWSASSGATSYVILGTTTSGSGYSTVATGITTTSYTATGLTNGTRYYYLVLAQGPGGNSGLSREASATPMAAPATPTNLAATAGSGQVQLTWSASSGATSYVVLGTTTSGSGYSTVATGITTTSYTVTGLANGTTYYYIVLAQGPGGNSGLSREASARPSSTPCSNPTVVPIGTSQVTLNTTAGVCYKVSQAIHGWGCSNFAGRTISVNGGTPNSNCGFTVSAWSDGAYYLNASAGTYSYATVYWW